MRNKIVIKPRIMHVNITDGYAINLILIKQPNIKHTNRKQSKNHSYGATAFLINLYFYMGLAADNTTQWTFQFFFQKSWA